MSFVSFFHTRSLLGLAHEQENGPPSASRHNYVASRSKRGACCCCAILERHDTTHHDVVVAVQVRRWGRLVTTVAAAAATADVLIISPHFLPSMRFVLLVHYVHYFHSLRYSCASYCLLNARRSETCHRHRRRCCRRCWSLTSRNSLHFTRSPTLSRHVSRIVAKSCVEKTRLTWLPLPDAVYSSSTSLALSRAQPEGASRNTENGVSL